MEDIPSWNARHGAAELQLALQVGLRDQALRDGTDLSRAAGACGRKTGMNPSASHPQQNKVKFCPKTQSSAVQVSLSEPQLWYSQRQLLPWRVSLPLLVAMRRWNAEELGALVK